jgi:hypothetical protein
MTPSNGRQVIVALHGNKPIPIGTLKSIIEGSGLGVDDFSLRGRDCWHRELKACGPSMATVAPSITMSWPS